MVVRYRKGADLFVGVCPTELSYRVYKSSLDESVADGVVS